MTSFGPSLGGLPSLRKLCPIFRFVCYVTSRKNQLFCAPILYRYIIIKLYNKTTNFRSLLPICVCFRGSAPDPAGGLTAPPRPLAGKDCASRKKCHLFFFPPMTCLDWLKEEDILDRTKWKRYNIQNHSGNPRRWENLRRQRLRH